MINSIPGYNVTRIDKNRYAVSVNNGNCGAVLMNKEQYKQFAAENGVRVNDHKGLKVVGVLAGIAGVVAAVIYRKDIAKFVQGLDFKGTYDKAKTYITKNFDKAKTYVATNFEKVKAVYKKNGVKGVWDKVIAKAKKCFTGAEKAVNKKPKGTPRVPKK